MHPNTLTVKICQPDIVENFNVKRVAESEGKSSEYLGKLGKLNTISVRENAAIVKNHIQNRGIKRT